MSGFSRHLLSFGLAAAAFFVASGSVPAGAQTPTCVQLPTATADPTAIAAGPDGNFWVTELVANQIARVTPSGTVTEFTIPTSNSLPNGITAGPDGNLWFTERGGGKIGRITTAGVITEFPIPSGNGAGAIAVGPDGNLWFGEPVGNMVGRITPTGVISEFALPAESGPGGPTSIATGPDGALWLTLPGLNSIAQITSDGATVNMFPIPTASSGAQTIALGSDGNLYFTESNVNQIGQITPDPSITEFPLPAGTTPFGIAPGPQGTVWFTGLGNNSLYQMILPLPAPLTDGAQGTLIFNQFPLSKSCGPSQIAPGPLTFPDMGFSCADTVLDSIGVMNSPASVTLTVDVLGNGSGRVISDPAGINCVNIPGHLPGTGESCSASFPSGQPVTLFPASAPTSATFAGWNLPPAAASSGCSGTNLCNLTLTADTTVTATFNPVSGTKELSVALGGLDIFVRSDAGPILCSSAHPRFRLCTAEYPTGTVVTLRAEGAGDTEFAGWSGGGCNGTFSCHIALDADTEVTALVGPATSGGSVPVDAAAATLPTDRNVFLGDQALVAQLPVLATSNGLSGSATNTVNTVTIFGTMRAFLRSPFLVCKCRIAEYGRLITTLRMRATARGRNRPPPSALRCSGTARRPLFAGLPLLPMRNAFRRAA
jgi:streptogramin lyase